MSGIISLEQFKTEEERKRQKINFERFVYLAKTAKQNSAIYTKRVAASYVDIIRDYLVENYSELLLDSFGNAEKSKKLERAIIEYLSRDKPKYDLTIEELATIIVNEICGLNVLEDLVRNKETITNIWVNDYNEIYVQELNKFKYRTHISFERPEDLQVLARKLVNACNKKWDSTHPEVDCDFPDIRVNIMGFNIPSASESGITMQIRIHSKELRITDESFVTSGQGNLEMLNFLKAAVHVRAKIYIGGSTNSGKTELFKYLVGFIRPDDFLLVFEEDKETFLKNIYPDLHITTWSTRESGREDFKVDYGRLLRSGLRNSPDIMAIQETRGKELYQLLTVGNTGHGMMCTGHIDSITSSVDRLILQCETVASMDRNSLGSLICNTFDLVILCELGDDRKFRIQGISEVLGFNNGKAQYNHLFEFIQTSRHECVENGEKKVVIDGYHKKVGDISPKLSTIFKKFGADKFLETEVKI